MSEPLIISDKCYTTHDIKDEDVQTENKDYKRAFSKPSLNTLDKLEKVRSLSLCGRIFRKMESGSLRGVIMMWIRMTLGIGILTLPFYVKNYGAIVGVIVIAICAIINFLAYKFIFEASDFTQKKNYPDLINELLGPFILKIFRITYMLDITSGFMIYSIVSWNLLEYMIYFFNIGENQWKDWFINIDKIQYNEMNPTIFMIRGIFFLTVFMISIPLFLRKNLESLQKITAGYLLALFVLIVIILVEVPSFRNAYKDKNIGFELYKLPTFNWIECFLGLCVSFYVQPFMFSLRGELLLPILRRTSKIVKTSVTIEVLIFVTLGFFGYFALGDAYTPNLFILRKPYPDKNQISETVFRCAIGLFFILNTIGLAMYNPTLRDYLYPFIPMKDSRLKFVIVSLLPFFIICCIAFVYPYVIDVTNLFGLTVYNFNGYIVPFMLRIQTLRRKNESSYKIVMAYFMVFFFVMLSVVGLTFRYLGLVSL